MPAHHSAPLPTSRSEPAPSAAATRLATGAPIGVVGAGVMGSGVAHALANAGYETVLIDIAAERLETAKIGIARAARTQTLLGRAASPVDPRALLARIRFATDHRLLADAAVVIENVPESWEVKRDLYRLLDEVCQ